MINVYSSLSHAQQHTYDEIVQWYQELAYAYDFVSYIPSIGKSIEGRDQPAVRIAALDDIEKFQIYFQCQIHARAFHSLHGFMVINISQSYR